MDRSPNYARALLCALWMAALAGAPELASAQSAETPATEAPAATSPTGATPPADGAAPVQADGAIDPAADPLADPEGLLAAENAMPRDLSPWGMFMQADWVVKAVMIGLAFASVVTWTVWLAKSLELAAAKRRTRLVLRTLQVAGSLEDAVGANAHQRGAAAALVQAADHELTLSSGLDAPGIKERIESVFERIQHAAARAAGRGTGLLATIGATAPFVGLFGTVWGIMNSFIGISKAQTTNLAVVAPGIAEALLATAIGLAAAIPAVVIYNHFTRLIASYRALLGDAAAGIQQLVSRDLDRGRLQALDHRREAAE
jgi:biopolymer transport protein ExbB